MKPILMLAALGLSFTMKAQSPQDSSAIRTAALDYVEGFFTADSGRLARAMSPELVKRIIDRRGGKDKLMTIGLKELTGYTKMGKLPDKYPGQPFKARIDIYDISSGIALAKVSTNKMPEFFDYIQVGQMNGEWKIINVLWAFH